MPIQVFAVLALAAVGGWSQPPRTVCALLTPAELTAVGVTLTSQGLMPDEDGTVTRAMLPGLPADLTVAQCTSEYVKSIGDVSVRFGVMTASSALDRAGWEAVDKALDDGSTPPPSTVSRVGDVVCEQITQASRERGQSVSSLACHLARGARFYTLEVAQRDASRLPTPASVASLLMVMKQRTP
jgi:hypothetical protein